MALENSRLEDVRFSPTCSLHTMSTVLINNSNGSYSDFNMDQLIFNDAEDIEIDEDNTGPTIHIRKLWRPWFFQLGLTMWWTPVTVCSMHKWH